MPVFSYEAHLRSFHDLRITDIQNTANLNGCKKFHFSVEMFRCFLKT